LWPAALMTIFWALARAIVGWQWSTARLEANLTGCLRRPFTVRDTVGLVSLFLRGLLRAMSLLILRHHDGSQDP
jgi:hypothetical protein